MEIISTILALSVGILAIRLHFKTNHYILLILGTGFIGTAFLDGYHATVTSVYIKDLLPSDLPSLLPWSWFASRLYLSVILFSSWVSWNNRRKFGCSVEIGKNVIFISSILLTLLSALFFIFAPLPRAYYPELFFHRPEEFLPALLFTIALIGYLKKGHWKTNSFEHWLIITLILNVVSQTLFMSLSGTLFDMEFNVAHVLKNVGYITMFISLLSYKAESESHDTNSNLTFVPKVQIESSKTKQSIARNILILIALLVIFSISIIITIVQKQFTESMEERGREQLSTEAARSALLFEKSMGQLERDTIYLAHTPPIQGIIRASQSNGIDPLDNSTIEQWRSRLEILFSQMLKYTIDDNYLSIRLIGVENNGRELVRVDRTGGNIKITSEEQLQEKGKQNYVKETIILSKDDVYYSDINLNREHGKIAKPHVPVMRISVPVFSDEGKIFGMVIINKNMEKTIKVIRKLVHLDHNFYVTNANGSFLVHPENRHEFGFESGSTFSIHDEFPSFIKDLYTQIHQEIIQKGDYANRRIANYLKVPLGTHSDKFIGFIVTSKYENIVAAANYNKQQIIILSLIIIGFALIIGWIFFSTIAAPLKYITKTMIGYSNGKPISDLPFNVEGEIGVLARSFNNLIFDVSIHTDQLESEINERKEAENKIKEYTKNLEQTKNNLSNILKNAVDTIISIRAPPKITFRAYNLRTRIFLINLKMKITKYRS